MSTWQFLLSAMAAGALVAQEPGVPHPTNQGAMCIDGFCIGQSISDSPFSKTDWIVPRDSFSREPCNGEGCKPQVAFRGYSSSYQRLLAETLSWVYGMARYNIITKNNLEVLRHYKYECNLSARGMFGERRFFGAYRSIPSHYLTVVGLRLINDELRVYRIAREYPYHNQSEFISLAKKLRSIYGGQLLLYNFLSSNAYSDVINQRKSGWFARSTMFNVNDLTNNAAELVLVDPVTRPLLEPTSLPESGEIKPLAVRPPVQCSESLPIQ